MSIESLLELLPSTLKVHIPYYGKPGFAQFVRFCIVGVANTLVQLALLFVFVEYAGFGYLLATSLAFIIAVTNSFVWNRLWTFKESRRHGAHLQWAGFMGISFLGFCLNAVLMYTLVDLLGLWYMLSQFLVAFVVVFSNFLGSKYLVFRR